MTWGGAAGVAEQRTGLSPKTLDTYAPLEGQAVSTPLREDTVTEGELHRASGVVRRVIMLRHGVMTAGGNPQEILSNTGRTIRQHFVVPKTVE
jgi:Asp-tRNA(Asn)/Glu-tRNA(Gln) amidotransferase C subunit